MGGKGRKYGVSIRNPLDMPVMVDIRCETGAMMIGNRHVASRILKPGSTLWIDTRGRCELDIYVKLIKYDPAGKVVVIGDGGFEVTEHKPPLDNIVEKPSGKVRKTATVEEEPKPETEAKIRSLADMMREFDEDKVVV